MKYLTASLGALLFLGFFALNVSLSDEAMRSCLTQHQVGTCHNALLR